MSTVSGVHRRPGPMIAAYAEALAASAEFLLNFLARRRDPGPAGMISNREVLRQIKNPRCRVAP